MFFFKKFNNVQLKNLVEKCERGSYKSISVKGIGGQCIVEVIRCNWYVVLNNVYKLFVRNRPQSATIHYIAFISDVEY